MNSAGPFNSATARELNQLTENHQENQQPSDALDRPPTNMMQVLAWLDDLAQPDRYPTNAQLAAARALPAETTLAETLKFLGIDLSEYGR